MSHFIKKCKECDKTIAQCRCPSPNKSIEYATCENCLKKPKDDEGHKGTIVEFPVKCIECQREISEGMIYYHYDKGFVCEACPGFEKGGVQVKPEGE